MLVPHAEKFKHFTVSPETWQAVKSNIASEFKELKQDLTDTELRLCEGIYFAVVYLLRILLS